MGDFKTKLENFFFGGSAVEEDNDYGYENEEYYDSYSDNEQSYDNNDFVEQSYTEVVDTPSEQQPQAYTTPVTQAAATVIMLSPYDIRTSQVVVDHIRQGHIVICNLTASQNNQRVVDFISGGLYAFDGKIEPTPVKTTFVCTPSNVNLIVPTEESAATKVSAL